MEVTDIGNKEGGKFWHRKPAPGKGVLVTVGRTAQQAKTVRFLHVAFDTTGDSFLAGDQHGNIYLFDITRNRFRLVQKTGQACTALAFSLYRTTEFIVALADYTIKCFDKDTKQLVSWMRGHEGTVSSISVHSSGHYAVTTSSDTAQLWDLDTFLRKKKLTIRQSVGIQKVFYIPHSDTILSCFSDDSIFAWDSDTLTCKYQLPVPDSGPRISYRAFAVTQDGRTLAAGGRSNLLHLWCLDTKQLGSVIQMPPPVRTIRQLEFLPDTFEGGAHQTLGVLSQDGVLCFLNTHTCKPLFHIGSPEDAITTVAVSPNSRYVVAILDNGTIRVYSVQSLTRELKKPPPSRVAAVSGAKAHLKSKVRSEVIRTAAKPPGLKTHETPRTASTADDKENDFPAGLSKKKLLAHLKDFGEYPAKYRMFLWRHLLRLPKNYVAYSALTDKGLHPAYFHLQEKYPIKSPRLQRGLQRVLSALAHWAPVCGETEYLPLVAFPFVKLFKNTPMLCFEVVATIIVNWCQHWFEYSPRPPLNILCMTENIVAHHDRQLLQHLKDCGITSQLYVWPLLETLFSEVLTRDEWLQLFDNVFSNHPSFLLMVCAAYVTFCRRHLLRFTDKEDFECFFHSRNNIDMGAIIAEAYRLMHITPADIHPRTMLSDFTPLTTGLYPVFSHHSEFTGACQTREREKIQLQEKEYLRERMEDSAMRTHSLLRQAQEKAHQVEQERLLKAAEQWRLRQQKEDKVKEPRRTLELQSKEFQLDATRRQFLKYGQDLNASQLHRLDQDVRRKMLQMDLCGREEAAAMEDLDRQMELEVQRRRLEQHLMMEPANEVQEEVALRRAERVQGRLHSFQADMQALEESLAEACQQQMDAEQERRRGRLEDLQWQTKAQAAREWDEVMISRAPTQEQRPSRLPADSDGQKQAAMRTVCTTRGFPHRPTLTVAYNGTSAAGPAVDANAVTSEPAVDMVCLNSRSPSDSTSSILSLHRGRAHMDSSERELLREIRELRRKLAARAGSSQSVHTLSSVS